MVSGDRFAMFFYDYRASNRASFNRRYGDVAPGSTPHAQISQ